MTSAQIAIMTTIILYLCLVIFTGVMIGKRSKKSAEGFYLGGRGMGPLVTAMSAEASDMSSYLLMGIPGLAYLSGVADASWTAIGLAIGTYLNFLLVARRLRRYSVELDAITIPSFISKRYGEKKPIIMGIASLIILVFFVPYVASGLAAIGKLFNSLFGWNYMLSVIVGAIVIISYTSVGGFSAVATMDLIQSVIMTVALCVIVVFGIVQAGGMDAVLAHASSLPGFLSFGQTYNAASGQAEPYGLIRIVSMLAWGLGYFGMPHILVRFMAIRHEDELKISRRIASIWVVISMAIAIAIGVIGLGNVGSKVANACVDLGMDVYGYDPFISVEHAWVLSREVQRVGTLEDLCRGCDYLTVHVPSKADTIGMISTEQINLLAPDAVLINYARETIIDEDAVDAALREGKLSWFSCDFATPKTVKMPNTFITTHSGAGTGEAEANCADMAISELKDYLENGNIAHSVNYPACSMGKARAASRIACLHANVPNMIGQITAILAKDNANVQRMTNESAGENAYTMFDTDEHLDSSTIEALKQIPSMYRVRVIK